MFGNLNIIGKRRALPLRFSRCFLGSYFNFRIMFSKNLSKQLLMTALLHKFEFKSKGVHRKYWRVPGIILFHRQEVSNAANSQISDW